MSIRVLVADQPHRVLALVTESHVLLFKHAQINQQPAGFRPQTATNAQTPRKPNLPKCMVEFLPREDVDLKGYRTLTTAKGTLGLITLGDDIFVCVATGSREVATVRPDETVMQITAVEFYCLNRADYDHSNGYGAGYHDGYREPNPYSNTLFETDDTGMDSMDAPSEHPFMALKKLLSGGTFYYSYNFDLTRRLQDRSNSDSSLDISSLDDGLLWNSYMINPLISFRSRLTDNERDILDRSSLLTSVIRGYVGTLTVPQNANPMRSNKSYHPATLTVISRLSARRAGTRFNARGIDDNGNVANFVETETVFWSPDGICFSYVQVRGSVPVFWESSSTLIPGQQKVQITRSPEATQLSFDRHFERLANAYGAVHVVNLLSESKPGEVELTERYNAHLARSSLLRSENDEKAESSRHDLLQKTEFDFHEVSRAAGGYDGAKKIRPRIAESAEGFGYLLTQEIEDDVEQLRVSRQDNRRRRIPVTVMEQTGVFRTNCLDCLDRTNLVQGIISQLALELFLEHRGDVAGNSNLSVFWMRHSSLWADNGDALSKIYAGTGALKSSFTRHGKMSLGGLMADARKSATRLYVNHFEDKGRQNTTDLLLGRLVGQEEVELVDPVSDWVQERLKQRADEFESSEPIKAWVGTYNLNGRMMRDASELQRWLTVRQDGGHAIVVVGFQEIVELSPQQIMNTDPARRVLWEKAVKTVINTGVSAGSEDEYILLRSGQLVGAALMIFVKASILSKIRNVEGAIKKTGMSGIAGNKGAVAIRMDIAGSSLCFVTAHLAAGFGNYEERNRDYQIIVSGLRFQRDRKIEDHEAVIWLGDFNYRIGTQADSARELVNAYRQYGGRGIEAEEALRELYRHDQLNIQMVAGEAFPFYQEGRIRFLPTYKFDLGNDDYDTSEKARIPAWTDRILYKIDTTQGTQLRQLKYTSVMDLRFSDHRPVFATFDIQVRIIDQARKAALLKELYTKRTRQIRGKTADGEQSSDEAEEFMGFQSIAPGLPPASSDRRKWWLDGDKPVASRVSAPQSDMKLNPDRAANPWRESPGDDWVVIQPRTNQDRTAKPPPPPPARKTTKQTAEASPSEVLRASATQTPPRPQSADVQTPQTQTTRGVSEPRSNSMRSPTTQLQFTAPPPPAPRQSRPSAISQSSTRDHPSEEHQPRVLVKPQISRTSSQASTASTRSKLTKAAPQRPEKPSSLIARKVPPAWVSLADADATNHEDLPHRGPTQAQSKSSSAEQGQRTQPVPSTSARGPSSGASTPVGARGALPEQGPPPLPQRSSAASVATLTRTAQTGTPPLPPRRGTGNSVMDAGSGGTADLLGDGVDKVEGEWKPLLPARMG